MERLTKDNFLLESVVKEVGKTEEGYIYIIDYSDERYELSHGVIDNKYLMYIKDGEKEVKILENKKDLEKIKDFIESIDV